MSAVSAFAALFTTVGAAPSLNGRARCSATMALHAFAFANVLQATGTTCCARLTRPL